MEYPSIFSPSATEKALERLEQLNPDSKALWGKMNVGQMLAHLNVVYDQVYVNPPSYNFFMRFLMKALIKNTVVGNKPYKRNTRTAPSFVIADEREFEAEKAKLIDNIQKTEQNGVQYFEGKKSPAFGVMTSKEWSTLFYKHMDHHFQQFGV